MSYYCRIDSANRLESTNLQLYSLKQAANYWNELIEDDSDCIEYYKERLVFILCSLGLSLFQLLGQNCPSPEQERMAPPGDILNTLLIRTRADRTMRRRLNNTFQDFLKYYDAVRHFGANKNENNYRTVDRLTLEELDRFRRMTIEIWDAVITMYRKEKENDLDEFRSVSEVVEFQELAEQ